MRRLSLALAATLLVSSCLQSNVVAPMDRGVREYAEGLEWSSANPEDVPGYYTSEAISGPMAAVLLRVYYQFRVDGSYAGAALVDGFPPTFQVLNGTWAFVGNRIQLDDADPASIEVGEERLRIRGTEGEIVLRREPQL